MLSPETYQQYLSILKEELVPAMGCTEPISLAYAAALARETLGLMPQRVTLCVSPNIIKNVKSVIVPHTGSLRGIEAAAAAGIVAGDASRKLEVLSSVTSEQIRDIAAYLAQTPISVTPSDSGFIFDIQVCVETEGHSAFVRIAGNHTHVVRIERNQKVLLSKPYAPEEAPQHTDHKGLNVEDIVQFADSVQIADIAPILDRQIRCNKAIAEEGLRGDWGASIGRVLLHAYGRDVHNLAKAMAAAGSDARMSGCELPVVINSGSGNQGLTASLPVIVYAEHLSATAEQLYRALVVSNLITIHLKTGIGCLSAYCGATSAGCGAGAGITYLYGGKAREIAHTIVNAVAINSGMICDGAKASCAAKIASAVEAGLLGMQMQMQGTQFYGGDGIIVKGVENTIENIGRLARVGMAETDKEIIQMMVGGC